MSQVAAICNKCGAPANLMCQRCQENYCGTDCQIIDWKEHKLVCIQMPSLVPIGKLSSTPLLQKSYRHNNPDVRRNLHESISSTTSSNMSKNPLPRANTQLRDENHFELKSKSPSWTKSCSPPSNVFFDVLVQFMEELNPSILWVAELKNNAALGKLLKEINRNINAESPAIAAEEVKEGILVAAPLDNVFYRAEVLKACAEKQHAVVRLIDYGNELALPYAKLRSPIPIMGNLQAYAIRVQVPADSGPFELESIITIRVTEVVKGGLYKAEIKPKNVPQHLPLDVLNQNPQVSLRKFFNGGYHALVQLQPDGVSENSDALNDFLASEQGIKFNFNKLPSGHCFVAARIEGLGWRRAALLGYCAKKQTFLVYLLDDGNISFCSLIKRIPDMFIATPMRTIAISLNEDAKTLLDEGKLKAAKVLSLHLQASSPNKEAKSLLCALHVNGIKLYEVMASTYSGLLPNSPDVKFWFEPLPDGSQVFITHVVSHSTIYITSLESTGYAQMFSELANDCAPFEIDDNIVVGNIVLAQLNRSEVFFRGEICAGPNANGTYDVFNIDTGAHHDVSHTALRKPNRFIRYCPVHTQKVNLVFLASIPNAVPDNKGLAALKQCIIDAIDFNVKYDEEGTVDLLFRTQQHESLSKKLLPMLFEKCSNDTSATNDTSVASGIAESTPLPPSPPNTPTITEAPVAVQHVAAEAIQQKSPSRQQTAVSPAPKLDHLALPNLKEPRENVSKMFSINDIPVVPISVGDNVPICVIDSSSINKGYITAVEYSKEKVLEMGSNLDKIGKYCKCPHVPRGYAPKSDEVCLAIFDDDGEWYRAMCINEFEEDVFEMIFVDYGNIGKVHKKNVMRIPEELLFPTYANVCYLEGLPAKHFEAFQIATSANPIINCEVAKQGVDAYNLKLLDTNKLFG